MAIGAEKRLEYEPAGALGLFDSAAVFLIRFDETETEQRPQDAGGACEDFDVLAAPDEVVMPSLVSASLGRGRLFNGESTGLGAKDREPGATLLTRDITIQIALSWDAVTQALGDPGTLVSRGLGSSPAEYVCYGLRLDVVDAPSFTAKLRWYWQDVAGVDQLQTGVDVCIVPGQFTLLTATRRWVAPDRVELAYYVGDQLLGKETSVDGSIGGGTTGTMQLGYRTVGGVNGNFLAGVLDEIMIVDREMCAEEVEATWLRLVKYQPLGVQLLIESFDPGFPLCEDRASDQALDIRMTGHALGAVAAAIENFRDNFVPQRAYGSTLAQWEDATRVTPKPTVSQSIEERRARVLARLQQKNGTSITGLKQALAELLDCDGDDLEFIAYSAEVADAFDTTIDPVLWDLSPTTAAAWNAGKARFAPGAGSFAAPYSWKTMARTVSQPSPPGVFGAEHVLAKLALTTPQNNVEAGVWFGDKSLGNYILLGLRQDGTFKVVTESIVANAPQGAVVQAALGGNPAAIWFHLREHAAGAWTASWSTTGPSSGFASSAPIAHPSVVHWGGMYLRSIAAVGAGPVADFDDFRMWMPNGTRPFSAYVFRDPGLGGAPDIEGAQSVIRAIKHGFIHAAIITSRAILSGDPSTLCDRGPAGTL